ncbi:MAG: CHAD domain-containing protein [Gemmatimonadota bacterium]|nr:CHAD domain-containing protein [Gemmatimonadota bacterium]
MTTRLDWDADTDSAQRAARVVALRALARVVAAMEQVRKKDADSIHDLRIAMRSLRSWLHVYRPALSDTLRRRTRRRLRRIARATTDLRDLDVQITWLKHERDALGDTRLDAARWIVRSLERDRRKAWRAFRRATERDFLRTSKDLEEQLTHYTATVDVRQPLEAVSMQRTTRRALQAQAESLKAALRRVRSPDDTRRLHRARIVAKRTRYTLSALSTPDHGLRAAVDSLHRFQDAVGELRDAQLLAHRVTREVTAVAAERAALVASELVYEPRGPMDFARVVGGSPFDASLSLLFARLRDRISAGSRDVAAAIAPTAIRELVTHVESASRTFARGTREARQAR